MAKKTVVERCVRGTTYYDNTLVVYGQRVAAYHHAKHGWGWFFENPWLPQALDPLKDIQPLRNIKTLEAEVRAALALHCPGFVTLQDAMDAEYGPRLY